MTRTTCRSLLALVLLAAAGILTPPVAGEAPDVATTAGLPDIAPAELDLLLRPLTKAQLEVEATAWLALLQKKSTQISNAEIAVKFKNREIKAAQHAAEAVKEAQEAAAESEKAKQDAQAAGDARAVEAAAEAAKEAEAAAAEAEQAVKGATEVEKENAANKEVGAAAAAAVQQAPIDGAAMKTPEQAAEVKSQIKGALLGDLATLRDQRTALVNRTNLVLDAWEAKGGDVKEQRMYVSVVSGLTIDVTDTDAAFATIVGWLKSKEGGLRWGGNLGRFAGIVIAAWLLSLVLGALAQRAMNRAMRTSRRMSSLMRDFISTSIRRIVLVVGVVIALSALEIEIGPLLAVIAGAGFVVAFALQDSLSNLASGIMILMYRPFDVGDVVDVASTSGKVKSMNLVSTTITTFDNKIVIVPNNSVWRGVITNATGSKTRRVDMVFGIGYDSDIAAAQAILERIVADHPAVLDDPAPTIKVNELGDSSVNFICRPWVKTADYWDVKWEVTRAVKEQFDEAGISIPFPQRDVHVYNTTSKGDPPITEVTARSGKHVVS